jgi:hypothetical protein
MQATGMVNDHFGNMSATRGTRWRPPVEVTKTHTTDEFRHDGTLNHAPNLTQRPPDSPRLRPGGYVVLARNPR